MKPLTCISLCLQSSGLPPSAFQLPYDSFKAQFDSDVSDDSHDIDEIKEGRSKDLDYDFACFFLSSPRLDLYRSIDLRCEDMVSGMILVGSLVYLFVRHTSVMELTPSGHILTYARLLYVSLSNIDTYPSKKFQYNGNPLAGSLASLT